jgi:hypothetical protein
VTPSRSTGGVAACTSPSSSTSQPTAAGWSEPFRPRAAGLGPGSLVAVDLAAVPSAVVRRWFPATVLALDAFYRRMGWT